MMGHMPHTDEAAALAAFLSEYIEEEGLSKREAAKRLGYTKSTLDRRLERADFRLSELSRVAKRLGMTREQLAKRLEVAA